MQSRKARIGAAIAFALSAAACTTTGQPGGALPGQRSTVAFESIDGPPPPVFQRLVRKLNEEAEARQVPVVTREGFAPYRVRGYAAVAIHKGQATVAWVWDVYDAQAARAFRLSGEEKAGRAGRDAWAAVNDEVLGRIARSGMEQLALHFRNPDSAPPPIPGQPGIAIAQRDDVGPEPSGIAPSPAANDTTAAAPLSPIPAPPRRPARGGRIALTEPPR